MTPLFNCYFRPFAQAQARIRYEPWFADDWVCKTGWSPSHAKPECVVFKLRRAHWSNDPTAAVRNASGLFFSVWVDEQFAAAGRMHYNIHALKLRQLEGYALESRKFAAAFRAGFRPYKKHWPKVRTDFGPQTLMQGWVKASPEESVKIILRLAENFQPLAELIEGLLEKHARD